VGAELVIPGITNLNTLVCISRSRTLKQYCLMVRDALAKHCPFCGEMDSEVNKPAAENEHWRAWHSSSPEKYTRLHLIFAPKRHVIDSTELSEEEQVAFWGIYEELKQLFSLRSCGFLMRDGDATLSAGTIEHLHAHVMVPDGKGRVETPFYKGAESEAESLARAIVFEKIRAELERRKYDKEVVGCVYHVVSMMEGLSPEEKTLVQGRLD
jgi:diadenosine tetraphosphate (Ap4A) HIT family hydrolase